MKVKDFTLVFYKHMCTRRDFHVQVRVQYFVKSEKVCTCTHDICTNTCTRRLKPVDGHVDVFIIPYLFI